MSSSTAQAAAPSINEVTTSGAPYGGARQAARRARVGIVILLIVGLVISSLSRNWAMSLQQKAYLSGPYAPAEGAGVSTEVTDGSTALGSLDSYFLILLLGGLRGPLVMFLWTSSENQKNERELEDFDTKVELIRLLQPEFDSVHIFQMWNKAYNISAQVASLPNKYAIILDALEYGRKVDRSRPNNLNILLELNKIYQHKLGTTTGDSVYYTRQVRADSKWREPERTAVGALNQRMPPVLDPNGNVLPELVQTISPRPANLSARLVVAVDQLDAVKAAAARANVTLPPEQLSPPAGVREVIIAIPEGDARKIEPTLRDNLKVRFVYADWNDGSDLQYLKRYEPYPYGVSPLALGFNYAKRAQVLMNRTGQRPAQSGPSVVDSRPGLELRHWGESEWDRGMAAEAVAFGRPLSNSRHQMLLPTADVPTDAKPKDMAALSEALNAIELGNKLIRDARAEYTRHLINPTESIRRMQDYSSHLDTLEADQLATEADLAYLRAIVTSDPAQKRALLAKAQSDYLAARTRYQAMELRYYTPGESESYFYPPNSNTRSTVAIPDWRNQLVMAGMPAGASRLGGKEFVDQPQAYNLLYRYVIAGLAAYPRFDQNQDAREENAFFIKRIDRRLAMIQAAGSLAVADASR